MNGIEIKGQRAMADHLGVSKSTLCSWIRRGIIPAGIKRGGRTSPMVWKEEISFEGIEQLRNQEVQA